MHLTLEQWSAKYRVPVYHRIVDDADTVIIHWAACASLIDKPELARSARRDLFSLIDYAVLSSYTDRSVLVERQGLPWWEHCCPICNGTGSQPEEPVEPCACGARVGGTRREAV